MSTPSFQTISASEQLLFHVETSDGNAEIPKGNFRISTVQYRTYEYGVDPSSMEATFKVHDANCREAKIIAKLVDLVSSPERRKLEALVAAANKFIEKVENGRARSVQTYREFKDALEIK